MESRFYTDHYLADRLTALKSLDPDQILAFLDKYDPKGAKQQRKQLAENPEVFWARIHKARLLIAGMDQESVRLSVRWLRDHKVKFAER